MKGSLFLTDVITTPDMLLPGRINIIEAGTSAGKTYFSLNTLPLWAGSPEKVLYLIDTTNGEMQLHLRNTITVGRSTYALADYNSGRIWGEFSQDAADKMPVMTYAGFGAELKNTNQPFWNQFKYIVCDEMPNLIHYQNFGKKDKNPRGNENLRRVESLLRHICAVSSATIVALSATPQKIRDAFGDLCYDVPFRKEDVIRYEEEVVARYRSLNPVLLNCVGKKGILYTERIEDMNKAMDFARQNGIRAAGFWSIHSKIPMSQAQLDLRQWVLENESIPVDVDLLVINASSETCIKIKESNCKVDYVIVHSQQKEKRIQARGRYCGDLDNLYLFDAEAKNHIYKLPERFLNTKLFAEDREALAAVLSLPGSNRMPLRWRGVRDILISSGFDIQEGRRRNKRYIIIRHFE